MYPSVIVITLACLIVPRPFAAILAFALICSFRSPRVLVFGSLALLGLFFPAVFFGLCGLFLAFGYLSRLVRSSSVSFRPPEVAYFGPLRLRGGANDDGEVPSLDANFYFDEGLALDDVDAGDEGLSLLQLDGLVSPLATPLASADLVSPSSGVGEVVSSAPAVIADVVGPAAFGLGNDFFSFLDGAPQAHPSMSAGSSSAVVVPSAGLGDLSAGLVDPAGLADLAGLLDPAGLFDPAGPVDLAGLLDPAAFPLAGPYVDHAVLSLAGPSVDLAATGDPGTVVPLRDGHYGELDTLLLSAAAPFLPAAGLEVDPLSFGADAFLLSNNALSLLSPEGFALNPSAGGLPAPAASLSGGSVPPSLSAAALPPASTSGVSSAGPAAVLGDLVSPLLSADAPSSAPGALSPVVALGEYESPLLSGDALVSSASGGLPSARAVSASGDLVSPLLSTAAPVVSVYDVLVVKFAALSLSDEAPLPLSEVSSSAGSVASPGDVHLGSLVSPPLSEDAHFSPPSGGLSAGLAVASGNSVLDDVVPVVPPDNLVSAEPLSPAAPLADAPNAASSGDVPDAAPSPSGPVVDVEPVIWEDITSTAATSLLSPGDGALAASVGSSGALVDGSSMILGGDMDVDDDGEVGRIYEDPEEVWDPMDIREDAVMTLRRGGWRRTTVMSRRSCRRRRLALPLGVPVHELSGPYIIPWYMGLLSYGGRRRNTQTGALVEYYTLA